MFYLPHTHTHPIPFSILIKRLEQFEVLDEIPKSRFSLTPDPSVLDDDKALLVAAIRIRAELDAELARLKARDEDDPKLASIPNSAHHAGGMSPSNSITSSSALHVVSTPLQSPVASVVVTPSSLVPASVPTLSTVNKAAKGKKTKASKGHLQVPAEKQKALSLKRKKPDADPNAPKKPSNAFFWFCQERRAALQEKFRGEGMSGQHDLTKALAKLWSETAAEDKKVSWGVCGVCCTCSTSTSEDYGFEEQSRQLVRPTQSLVGVCCYLPVWKF